jgi:hypothetical protein
MVRPFVTNLRRESETASIMESPSSMLDESLVCIAVSPKTFELFEEWCKGKAVIWDQGLALLLSEVNGGSSSNEGGGAPTKRERFRNHLMTTRRAYKRLSPWSKRTDLEEEGKGGEEQK